MPLKYAEFVDFLPRRMKSRFESLGSFVDAIRQEREETLPKERHLKGDDIQTIKLAVFVFALEEFLREGSRAAARAVDEFAALGVPGFRVGLTLFEGRNENVVRGERLAQALREAVGDPEILSVIDSSSTIRDLVLALMRGLSK